MYIAPAQLIHGTLPKKQNICKTNNLKGKSRLVYFLKHKINDL